MKAHDNVARLILHLQTHPQPLTIAGMVQAGIMPAIGTSHAIRYGIKRGVIERIRYPDSPPNERFRYRWTGRPLTARVPPSQPLPAGGLSFDGLLDAWGIARQAPSLHCLAVMRRVVMDDDVIDDEVTGAAAPEGLSAFG